MQLSLRITAAATLAAQDSSAKRRNAAWRRQTSRSPKKRPGEVVGVYSSAKGPGAAIASSTAAGKGVRRGFREDSGEGGAGLEGEEEGADRAA